MPYFRKSTGSIAVATHTSTTPSTAPSTTPPTTTSTTTPTTSTSSPRTIPRPFTPTRPEAFKVVTLLVAAWLLITVSFIIYIIIILVSRQRMRRRDSEDTSVGSNPPTPGSGGDINTKSYTLSAGTPEAGRRSIDLSALADERKRLLVDAEERMDGEDGKGHAGMLFELPPLLMITEPSRPSSPTQTAPPKLLVLKLKE
ncbi:hypothetical protein BDZ91DRAFT_765163 [Kalaharituber pfeilii]|nr:hypothetical protein BDZ91DRAFT_765163 [Kalaharituber pfeilii]